MMQDHRNHYLRFGAMMGLSFLSMYILMYAMVDSFSNVYPNINQLYMAALMTAPMAIFELLLMGGMYRNRRRNALILASSAVVLLGSWVGVRQQAAVTDEQFLKSMIPHHGGAILMCEDAAITDPEVKELCRSITSSQLSEIEQMKAKLAELSR